MSVQFEEDQFQYGNKNIPNQFNGSAQNSYGNQGGPSGMAGWLLKKGIVKTEDSAQYVLVSVVIINIIVVFFVFKFIL